MDSKNTIEKNSIHQKWIDDMLSQTFTKENQKKE